MSSSVIEGLAAYRQRKAEEAERRAAAEEAREAGRINRFSLADDGDSAVIRFAQEIDADATNYSAERGLGVVNIEHNHPDPNNGWKNRGNCSVDSQGACFPCEKVADRSVDWNARKGWKQKEKFYVNVIAGPQEEVEVKLKSKKQTRKRNSDVDRKTGDGEVFLLEQGTFNGIWDALVAYVVNEETPDTILDRYFTITRKGKEFNDTSYTLTPGMKELPKGVKDLDEFELIDFRSRVLNEVPYAEQDAFYHRGVEGGTLASENVVSEDKPKADSADGETW